MSESEETRFPDDKTTYTIEYIDGNWKSVSIPNAPAIGVDQDGNYVGFDLDLAKEIFESQNISVKFQPIDWDSKEMELNLKKEIWKH